MEKIVSLQEAIDISKKLRKGGKAIVLAGGCFDILHPGHFFYLEKAGEAGDVLFVLLESDENVRRLKGRARPVNSQEKRAAALSRLPYVDYVVLLPPLVTNQEYFEITKELSPQIIAITEGDSMKEQKEKQAKEVGGKVAIVTKHLPDYSTTKILSQK